MAAWQRSVRMNQVYLLRTNDVANTSYHAGKHKGASSGQSNSARQRKGIQPISSCSTGTRVHAGAVKRLKCQNSVSNAHFCQQVQWFGDETAVGLISVG